MSQHDQQPSTPSRVTSIHFSRTPVRKKPKPGDRRTTKLHGLQIRVQVMAKDACGRPIGRVVNYGRPSFEWRKPEHLEPWDQHHLTAQEREALLPSDKQGPGQVGGIRPAGPTLYAQRPGFGEWKAQLDAIAAAQGCTPAENLRPGEMDVWIRHFNDGKTPEQAWDAVPYRRR